MSVNIVLETKKEFPKEEDYKKVIFSINEEAVAISFCSEKEEVMAQAKINKSNLKLLVNLIKIFSKE